MNEQNHQENSKEQLLAEIKSGQVKMRPKYFFILKAGIFVAGAVFVFLILVFLISFTIFVLRSNGSWFLPDFGWRGFRILFLSFPWILVLAAAILVFILEALIKRFGFAYRRPLIYSILGIVVIITSGGIMVAATSLHQSVMKSAIEKHLPWAGPLYLNFAESPLPNIFPGRIFHNSDNNELRIETLDGRMLKLEISTSSDCGKIGKKNFKENQRVMIMGERDDLKINACGFREFKEGQEPLFYRSEIQRKYKNNN